MGLAMAFHGGSASMLLPGQEEKARLQASAGNVGVREATSGSTDQVNLRQAAFLLLASWQEP